jgi:hypothetical protein
MIQQKPNDFLEIYYEDNYYYLVVLTKIVLFGGNIVFGFHGDGSKKNPTELLEEENPKGFNCCTDLLTAKKFGEVRRIEKLEDVSRFWRTKYAKSPIGAIEWGDRVKGWYIYSIHNLQKVRKVKFFMTKKYKEAMENECAGFGAYVQLVQSGFTPDQSLWLKKKPKNEN